MKTHQQAGLMDGVATIKYRSGSHRIKKELKAHWTVLFHAVFHTNMVTLQQILAQDQQVHDLMGAQQP